MQGYASIKISDTTLGNVTRTVCANIADAVAGAGQRNQQCIDYDDQLYMRMIPLQINRWRNSCELNAPLTWELAITLHAMLMQAARRDPKWMVEAHNADDDDKATLLEDYINALAQKYRLNRILEEVAWNAIRDDVSVLYAGWKQHYTHTEKTKYREKGKRNAFPIDPEDRIPGTDYEQLQVLEPSVERQGLDARAVELTDFFLYPANAAHIQEWEPRGAIGVGERIFLSKQQLLDGRADFDYDPEAVEQLIERGPTDYVGLSGDELRTRIDEFNGVTGDINGPQDGYWECFIWFQRLPDDDEIPLDYLRKDAMIVCCPQHQIVLKMTLSPYSQRPYIPFYIKPRSNSFLGTGLCQMLSQLQEEDTTSLRQDIDAMDLRVCGERVCSPQDYMMIQRQPAQGPGTFLIETQPNTIRVLPQPPPTPFAERSEYTRGRGQGLISAQGFGEMGDKVRKAAEVQNTVGAADSKFELYLSNWQEGLCDLGAWSAALHATGGDEETQFKDSRGRAATITQADMEGQYSFVPAATSTTANPEARYKLGLAVAGEQTRFMGLMNQSPPAVWPLLWHASRQILIDLGVRRPENYIGPEPQPPPPPPPGIQTFIQSLQQQGVDPKIIQQALSNMQQQQALGLNMQSAANGVLSPGAPPGGVA